jgi:hypothetical protein
MFAQSIHHPGKGHGSFGFARLTPSPLEGEGWGEGVRY